MPNKGSTRRNKKAPRCKCIWAFVFYLYLFKISRLMVHVAVFTRRTILLLFEQAVERGNAWEPSLKSNLCNRKSWLAEQFFGHSDASVVDVVTKCEIGVLLEQSGEVVLTKSHRISHCFQSQIFHIMGVDIVQKFVEFLNVGFLFARFYIWEDVGSVDVVMAKLNKEI